MIYGKALVFQHSCNTTIPISALILMEYPCDFLFDLDILVYLAVLQMIVEGGSRELGYVKQYF